MLPILVQVDNEAAVDLANGWTVGGNMKHSEVRLMYLQELKQRGIILVEWHPTDENESDIVTKNVDNNLFRKHATKICNESEV